MKLIQAKTILSKVKNDNYFGITYNMNLYRGCQHACIYCDSRSSCYHIKDFSEILVKENATELLEKELKQKRKNKGTIGFGSMNDPYMQVEKETELSKKALELIVKYRYPVHILTKSNLVLRDINLFKKISKIYAAVSFTITTADDKLARIIEPKAPSSSKRFEAIKILSENNIYTGITLMPLLPFINDTEKNIRELIEKAHLAGAKYIIPYYGVTLREGSREYFYNELEKSFPNLKEKYQKSFGNKYSCIPPRVKRLYSITYELCKKYKIPCKMEFYKKPNEQLSVF